MTAHIRWSDNDRYFGPFTYASERGYRRLGVILGSGDGDDYPHCRLRMHGFGNTLIVALPPIIKPERKWVDTSRHDWSRGPGSGYWETHARDFGFCFVEGALHLDYGAQTDDSTTDKSKCYFLPWRQWRHIRRSFYDLNGDHFYTLAERKHRRAVGGRGWHNHWEAERAIEGACPAAVFEFSDFDGERISAETKIEEREWRFGEGRFKWLSLFRRPKIQRSLAIQFSAETGRRKGSWKGGTIGCGINMLPGELHEAAFQRYCAENAMTFVGSAQGISTGTAKTAQPVEGEACEPGPKDAPKLSPNQTKEGRSDG